MWNSSVLTVKNVSTSKILCLWAKTFLLSDFSLICFSKCNHYSHILNAAKFKWGLLCSVLCISSFFSICICHIMLSLSVCHRGKNLDGHLSKITTLFNWPIKERGGGEYCVLKAKLWLGIIATCLKQRFIFFNVVKCYINRAECVKCLPSLGFPGFQSCREAFLSVLSCTLLPIYFMNPSCVSN